MKSQGMLNNMKKSFHSSKNFIEKMETPKKRQSESGGIKGHSSWITGKEMVPPSKPSDQITVSHHKHQYRPPTLCQSLHFANSS